MIIECPLKDLFHDVTTVILTSRMGVSEIVLIVGNIIKLDNDCDDDNQTLEIISVDFTNGHS